MVLCLIIFLFPLVYFLILLWANNVFINLKPFHPTQYIYRPVSIIIPARNEEKHIGRCLDSLLAQDYPSELMEIIVVDDQSDDRTASIVKSYEDIRIQLIKILSDEKFGKKSSVAKGIHGSNYEIIITTDADCIFQKQWLATMVTCKENRDAVLVAAPVAFQKEKNYLDVFQSLDFISLQGITAVAVSNKLFNMCNGANLLYTRTAFDAVHGFQNIDQIASGDDMLLMEKIDKAFSHRITYCYAKEAIVETVAASDWRAFFQQRIRWASKAKNYQGFNIKAMLLLVFLVNLISVVLFILSFMEINYVKWYLLFMLIKVVGEIPFMLHVSMFFNKQRLITWFIPTQILHTIYTIIAAFFGWITRYEWKGRKVR